ncbi:uncharacterized protein LOC120707122 isoform X5 [Panicum virgatum]|uniref:uncharacterized protein LOC120707122 isoform X5 n=1 Tax=Panicum virgatum TaxID=38727 RepID=UPI0019D68B73|nr:uncharacterized protein LOC120707122 isoform X5 [Panicum virgatum]
MAAYGGGGARGITPLRSCRTGPSASAPHSGSAPPYHVPEVGELTEVVQGALEIGYGEKFLDVRIEMCGEGPAALEEASSRAEGVHAYRDSARLVYGEPAALQSDDAKTISMAGRVLLACAQKVVCFPVACGLVVEAALRGGRGCRSWDRGRRLFDHASQRRVLLLAASRVLGAQMNNQDKTADIDVDIPGPIVHMVKKSQISHGAIEYLVIDEAGRILDMMFESQTRMIVYMMNMPSFPPDRQVADSLRFWLFSKGFPATEICGDRTQQRLASGFSSNVIFVTVRRVGSSTYLMVLIEFVIDGMKRGFLLCPVGNQFVGAANRKLHELLSLFYVEMQWETDSLRYWLYSKGFPATLIFGDTCPMYNQQCDLESGVDILVATPGYHVDFVEGWWFSFEGIKYLVMDGGDTEKTKIVDMKNRSKDSVNEKGKTFSFQTGLRVVVPKTGALMYNQKIEFVNDGEKRVLLLDLLHNQSVGMASSMEADSLRFCLFSKGFPATGICGDRTQQRSIVLSNYMCTTVGTVGSDTDMFEQKIEFVDNLDKRCFLQDLLCKKSGSLCGPLVPSFQSAAWLYLFIAIMFLLIPRSSQLPITDNTTEICPAPYMQFKRPAPVYVPRLFKPEDLGYKEILMLDNTSTAKSYAQQWALTLGPTISFLANFAPLITAHGISNVAAKNILLQGISCLLFAQTNLSWTFYLHNDSAGTVVYYSAIFAALLNAFWSVFFWKNSSLDAKQTMLALLACVIMGTISYACLLMAGVFALICLLCGHFFRIKCMCHVQKFHGFTCAMSFLGLGGSLCSLYGVGIIGPVTIPKVFSAISFVVRMIDIPLQVYFRCCIEQTETTAVGEGDKQRRELALNEPLLHPGPNISQNNVDVDRIDVLDDEQSELSLGLNDGDMHTSTDTPRSSALSGHSSGSISDSSTEAGSQAETSMAQAERNGRTDVASEDVIPSSFEQAYGVEDCEAAPSEFNGHETMETRSVQANMDGSIEVASIQNISNSVKQASDGKDSGLAHSELTTRMPGKLENDNKN